MDLIAACENFGQVNNTEKTVAMHKPPSDVAYVAPQINVNGAQPQVVDNFIHLVSTLSRATKISDEVARRISEVSQAFGRLQSTGWSRHGLHINTKRKMYNAVVLPTLLYRAVTWTVYKKQTHSLSRFHLTCLRRVLKLRWQDRILDTDVLERTEILNICAMLRQLKLRGAATSCGWTTSGYLNGSSIEMSPWVPADKEVKFGTKRILCKSA
nr:unnamed protein product [Spirometra erinaceieuropaei]